MVKLPEWGTPVPGGSLVFPGWAQHTYSWLSSFAGGDLVSKLCEWETAPSGGQRGEAHKHGVTAAGARPCEAAGQCGDHDVVFWSFLVGKLVCGARACVGDRAGADHRRWPTLDYLGYIRRTICARNPSCAISLLRMRQSISCVAKLNVTITLVGKWYFSDYFSQNTFINLFYCGNVLRKISLHS